MPDIRRIYLDACVFLSYINGEPERLPSIDALLDEARRGEIELLTSVVSITEVAFGKAEQDGQSPDAATLEKIENLWRPPSPIKLVDFYDLLAEEARAVVRMAIPTGAKPIKPMDAIHVATAKWWSASAFYTYDEKLPPWGPTLGLTIEEPSPLRPHLPWNGDPNLVVPTAPPQPSAQSGDVPPA
jgi:predicted nucleic acid-binding protein